VASIIKYESFFANFLGIVLGSKEDCWQNSRRSEAEKKEDVVFTVTQRALTALYTFLKTYVEQIFHSNPQNVNISGLVSQMQSQRNNASGPKGQIFNLTFISPHHPDPWATILSDTSSGTSK
jgi:hypothetical protein